MTEGRRGSFVREVGAPERGRAWVSWGVRIGLRVDDPATLDRIDRFLPYNFRPVPPGTVDRLYSIRAAGGFTLDADGRQLMRSRSLRAVLETFEADARIHVADAARRRVFVHAGVVAWEGRALLLPGKSTDGKSTLVHAFLRAGCTYYSDEYAVLDARGRVHPYARPLRLRQAPGRGWVDVDAGSLGASIGVGPAHLHGVLVTRFRAGAVWAPTPLSPTEGLRALLAHTVSARRKPAAALDTLAAAVASSRLLRGDRGEATEAVPLILRAFGATSRGSPPPP